MIVERLAGPVVTAPKVASPTAGLSQVFACLWWLVRAHMADRQGLPRDKALGSPPAAWLGRWPRGPM